jgi:hypothetical protein
VALLRGNSSQVFLISAIIRAETMALTTEQLGKLTREDLFADNVTAQEPHALVNTVSGYLDRLKSRPAVSLFGPQNIRVSGTLRSTEPGRGHRD